VFGHELTRILPPHDPSSHGCCTALSLLAEELPLCWSAAGATIAATAVADDAPIATAAVCAGETPLPDWRGSCS
jgi:hypothetical protein